MSCLSRIPTWVALLLWLPVGSSGCLRYGFSADALDGPMPPGDDLLPDDTTPPDVGPDPSADGPAVARHTCATPLEVDLAAAPVPNWVVIDPARADPALELPGCCDGLVGVVVRIRGGTEELTMTCPTGSGRIVLVEDLDDAGCPPLPGPDRECHDRACGASGATTLARQMVDPAHVIICRDPAQGPATVDLH